jgi:bifunctional protein TilS/HprT
MIKWRRRYKVTARDLRSYYKAIRRGIALIGSDADLKSALDSLVQITSRAIDAGVSILLLDSSGNTLAHRFSWNVPKAYLQKNVLDARKSLAEVISGQPVAISDVTQDNRIQYPEIAVKAGITSILGVPILVDGIITGSIRIYSKEHREFSQQDTSFILAVANLITMVIKQDRLSLPKQSTQSINGQAALTAFCRADTVKFAHPSEEDFACWLDFYRIEWMYEPRSFAIQTIGAKTTEMFTPDFYLPGLNLYVELTTMKQRLVTEKNRKLRRLRELYPDIKITLLYKKDFERLLAKYQIGPLSQSRSQGVQRVLFSEVEIQNRVNQLAVQISRDYSGRQPILIGVLRGVFCFMADLVRQVSIPIEVEFMAVSYYSNGATSAVKITKDLDLNIADRNVIMVEDIVDTGMTLNYILNHIKAKKPASLAVCALLDKHVRRIVDVPLDYVGFKVGDEFVVGYGLDFQEEYRNLPFISVLNNTENQRMADMDVNKEGDIKGAPR